MKKYNVTVNSSILNEDRVVSVEARDAQNAHKEAMFCEGFDLSFDKIVEIRNAAGVLVYGSEGFVNARRDQEQSEPV